MSDNPTAANDTNYLRLGVQTRSWILSEVATIIFFITTIWFSISLTVYVYQAGKWRPKTGDFTRSQVFLSAICIGPLTAIRLILTQTLLLIGYGKNETNDHICEVVLDMSNVFVTISLSSVCVYLWLRQRAFYKQPFLKDIYTIKVKVLSWLYFFGLIVVAIGLTVALVYPSDYESSNSGCVLNFTPNDVGLIVGVGVGLFLSQSILVGLFIYPLIIHRKVQVTMLEHQPDVRVVQRSNTVATITYCETNQTSFTNLETDDVTGTMTLPKTPPKIKTVTRDHHKPKMKKHARGGDKVLKLIKRSVACALVCILIIIIVAIIIFFVLPRTTPLSLTHTLYNLICWVNILSVILSFENYREILYSPCLKIKNMNCFKTMSSLQVIE